MTYGPLFLVVGAGFAVIAARAPHVLVAAVLAWPAVAFVVVGAGYVGAGPGVLGKRADGSRPLWRSVALAPYFALARTVWWGLRVIRREAPSHALLPHVRIGRRPLARELPADVDLVVDLTSEMTTAPGVRERAELQCVPTLDATPPGDAALLGLVQRLLTHEGTAWVHCAEGHGRAGTVAAALMIASGVADSAEEAEAAARARRPGVRLQPPQRRALERLAPKLIGLRGSGGTAPGDDDDR